MSEQLAFLPGAWWAVDRCDERARRLADSHYSRQTPGARDFMSSGRTLVLLTLDSLAVWGAIENLDPAGGLHWRVSIFRNTSPARSSELVAEGTARTFEYWERHYGARPRVPLRTEVDPSKTRRKRDPGRCFLKAGWRRIEVKRGLVILEAPGESERVGGTP